MPRRHDERDQQQGVGVAREPFIACLSLYPLSILVRTKAKARDLLRRCALRMLFDGTGSWASWAH
eukprot:scaffold217347_cov27-Tisochrysis_lutea.AAC.4